MAPILLSALLHGAVGSGLNALFCTQLPLPSHQKNRNFQNSPIFSVEINKDFGEFTNTMPITPPSQEKKPSVQNGQKGDTQPPPPERKSSSQKPKEKATKKSDKTTEIQESRSSWTLEVKGQNIPPEYPETARLEGREGVVMVQCIVDCQGNVTQAQVKRGEESDPEFEEAALKAVRRWHYQPPPTPVRVILPIRFSLKDSPS